MMYVYASISSRAANSLLLRAVITLAVLTYYTTSAQPPLPPKCSCSPTTFSFQLNFEGTCESTKVTGVSDELCFINVRPPPESASIDIEEILSLLSANKEQRRLSHEDHTKHDLSSLGNNYNQRALNSQIPTRVTRVEIYEYDTSAELGVINQDILSNQNLSDGDTITFTSISSQLDPNKPLDDQLQYFPNGIILVATGVNSNNENVTNTFAWNYNVEDCTTEQIAVGDYIGWMNVADVTPANGAFCPATDTPPPTPPPTLTTTPAPTLLPTPAPTTAKPVSHSMSYGKSAKSSSSSSSSSSSKGGKSSVSMSSSSKSKGGKSGGGGSSKGGKSSVSMRYGGKSSKSSSSSSSSSKGGKGSVSMSYAYSR